MNISKYFLLLSFLLINISSHAQSLLESGTWQCTLQLTPDAQLPFLLSVSDSGNKKNIFIVNGAERIPVQSYREQGDSIFIVPSVFQTEIKAKFFWGYGEDFLEGIFIDYARASSYVIPFKAHFIPYDSAASIPAHAHDADFNGKWEAHFSPGTADSSEAIGIFKQDNVGHTSGTFLTTTGDYRFLSGYTINNRLILSAFDGAHLFLFKAEMQNDKTLKGEFWSGKHWHEHWTAKRNSNFELPASDKLTFLKPGWKSLQFSFPDADSNLVSLTDKKFENKVVLVQISGSWCPNCMDETRVLIPLYKKYHEQGLEIIMLNYERKDDWSFIQQTLKHEQQVFQIPYPILFAGLTSKSSESLPMLNKISGYPTLIFMDREGIVRKIETGINGPATGDLYEKWKDDLESYVEKLLQ
ncbi:MAG: TlpA disulfide reductase family protein [Bacteroidota bacterium]